MVRRVSIGPTGRLLLTIPLTVCACGGSTTSERLSSSAQVPDLSAPGPQAAGWRRVTVPREDGSGFTALLTYPARAAGESAALDEVGGPYPAVVFGHGFFQTPDRYQGTLNHLATWGYLTLSPESQTGLATDHAAFAADLSAGLTWLIAQDSDATSWLAGHVATTALGASGHSMGAGASLLAAADDPRIKTVANLAAAETRPSALAAMPRIHMPLSLVVGGSDSIVPPESTARMYDAANSPRQLVRLEGGYHCGFEDTPFPLGCDSGPLPPAEQLALTRSLLTAWFGLYLKGDRSLYQAVWGPPSDSRVTLTADPGILSRSAVGAEVAASQLRQLLVSGYPWRTTLSRRRASPTDQAWKGQPRGSCGASPSAISGRWPRLCGSRVLRKGSRKSLRASPRAVLPSSRVRTQASTKAPIRNGHTVPWWYAVSRAHTPPR